MYMNIYDLDKFHLYFKRSVSCEETVIQGHEIKTTSLLNRSSDIVIGRVTLKKAFHVAPAF